MCEHMALGFLSVFTFFESVALSGKMLLQVSIIENDKIDYYLRLGYVK